MRAAAAAHAPLRTCCLLQLSAVSGLSCGRSAPLVVRFINSDEDYTLDCLNLFALRLVGIQ